MEQQGSLSSTAQIVLNTLSGLPDEKKFPSIEIEFFLRNQALSL